MEHLVQQAVCDLMPCELKWSQLENSNGWKFWCIKPSEELEYQRMPSAPVDFSSKWLNATMPCIFRKTWCPFISLVQLWAPIKVNGSTFLSIADQPFILYRVLDKRLFSYRRLCLDTSITIENYKEGLLGPPGRVLTTHLPEYNPDVQSYSAVEFPLLESAIHLGIHSYYAFPVFDLHYHRCLGVFEIVSTEPSIISPPQFVRGLDFKSFELACIFNSRDKLFRFSKPPVHDRLDEIKKGLHEIVQIHSLPFAQIWIPHSISDSVKVLYRAGDSIYKHLYHEFKYVAEACIIESGKALVGRAFASHGSCFCKDVTLLSINDYPLVPSARKARFTLSFAICLQSKCANNIIYIVEYFLPPYEMVSDTKTFLNMLLSTMKEQLPGFIVAPGKELGQRMLVEVVKVSPTDEFDSFEIGQPLPSVQSLQDGGETTEIDSFCQQLNLQNRENNDAAALLVPSCSLHKCDSLDCERTVQADPLLSHPIGEAVTNRGAVNLDVAHDGCMEDISEIMRLDSEINSAGNTTTNNEKIHSHKNNTIQRIEKDHGITLKILKQHYGMTLEDAAKSLRVSRATLKRICRGYNISRWPHHKTRKVDFHVSQGISFQGAEPCMDNQQCPALSHENGTDCLGHKRSPATAVPHDSLMTLKVTYRSDIIKFQLSLSSTRAELEGEVEKRLKISLQRFSVKYQDEDNDWILITSDSDLRDGMHSLMALGRTTMRLLVTPKADT